MENLRATVQEASFWCNNAGQLQQLVLEADTDRPERERFLELAGEYDRLADKLVADWARTRTVR